LNKNLAISSCKFLLLLTAIVAVVSCEKKSDREQLRFLSTSIDSLLNTVPDFSGVVLVAREGRPFYHKGFGYRNFETKDPIDTNSVFELASVSKQFTAMVIMLLCNDGKLKYDDPIDKFIPALPYPGITIRHLLNHTSGLPDYQAIMDQYWDKNKIADNDDNIAYLKKYRPERNFSPGEKFEYSNTGYMLLASIAEQCSGEDFIELCRDRIFSPLHMDKTAIRTKEAKLKLPDMAWGHLFVEEKRRYIHADSFPEFNYTIWLGNRKGPGRVSSTAGDLLKWDRALSGNALVPDRILAEAFSPAVLNNGSRSNYGFGWSIREDPEHGKIVFHTGDNPGVSTMIARYLDKKLTVIMLCNNGHPKFGTLATSVQKIILAQRMSNVERRMSNIEVAGKTQTLRELQQAGTSPDSHREKLEIF
jgi:CubicO group peptidase (beta-lactamase class C family)